MSTKNPHGYASRSMFYSETCELCQKSIRHPNKIQLLNLKIYSYGKPLSGETQGVESAFITPWGTGFNGCWKTAQDIRRIREDSCTRVSNAPCSVSHAKWISSKEDDCMAMRTPCVYVGVAFARRQRQCLTVQWTRLEIVVETREVRY